MEHRERWLYAKILESKPDTALGISTLLKFITFHADEAGNLHEEMIDAIVDCSNTIRAKHDSWQEFATRRKIESFIGSIGPTTFQRRENLQEIEIFARRVIGLMNSIISESGLAPDDAAHLVEQADKWIATGLSITTSLALAMKLDMQRLIKLCDPAKEQVDRIENAQATRIAAVVKSMTNRRTRKALPARPSRKATGKKQKTARG